MKNDYVTEKLTIKKKNVNFKPKLFKNQWDNNLIVWSFTKQKEDTLNHTV